MLEPYYADDLATLYHGDSRDLLPELEQVYGPVCTVVTDPPYGIQKADWDDVFPVDLLEASACLAGRMAVMPGLWNLLRLPERIGGLFYRWTLAAHLVNGMTRGAMGWGNWIPCVIYSRDKVPVYGGQESDAQRIVVGREEKPDHPSPKPLSAMRWFVSRVPGQPVLDPFAGSGTTLVAAKELGRRCIGIEIEERYCELTARRLSQGVLLPEAQPALRSGGSERA